MKFKIVKSAFLDDLEATIGEHLADGWLLVGGPATRHDIVIAFLQRPSDYDNQEK